MKETLLKENLFLVSKILFDSSLMSRDTLLKLAISSASLQVLLSTCQQIPSWLFHSHFTEIFIFVSADLHFCPHSDEFPPSAWFPPPKNSLKKLSQASCCIHFQDVFRLKVEIHCTLAPAQWLTACYWILYIMNKSVCPFIPSHNEKESCKNGSNALPLCSISPLQIENVKEHHSKGWMRTNERREL